MITLSLFSLALFSESALDEVYFRFFDDVLMIEDRAFLLVSGSCKVQLLAYDFGDEKLLSHDDRIPLMTASCLMHHDQSVVLVDGLTRSLISFDRDLAYLSRSSFDAFDWGEAEGLFAASCLPETETRMLVTLRDHDDRGKLCLARVDLEEKKVEILTRRVIDSKHEAYWLPWRDRLLFVHLNTGRIDLLEPGSYRTEKTIRPGVDPLERKRFRRPWRPPYQWLIYYPHQLDESMYWTVSTSQDAEGNPLPDSDAHGKVLKLAADGRFTTSSKHVFPLAVHGGEALVIDWDGPELKIVSPSEVP